MPHNSINLNNGVQGFVSSLNSMNNEGSGGDVKIYAKPLTDEKGVIQKDSKGRTRYVTYASNKSKGIWFGGAKRRNEKSRNASSAFNQFIRDVSKQLGLNSDQQTTASTIAASVFSDPQNAVQNMKRLGDFLSQPVDIQDYSRPEQKQWDREDGELKMQVESQLKMEEESLE